MMKLSTLIYHPSVLLILFLLPYAHCRDGIRSLLDETSSDDVHQQEEQEDSNAIFIPPNPLFDHIGQPTGWITCPEAMAACKARHEPGTLSYEGWSDFLEKLLDDDDTNSNNNNNPQGDGTIGKIRDIVDLAKQLGSPEEMYQEILEDMTNEQVAEMALDLILAPFQNSEDDGEITENFTEILQAVEDKFNGLAEIPVVGAPLAILFSIIVLIPTLPLIAVSVPFAIVGLILTIPLIIYTSICPPILMTEQPPSSNLAWLLPFCQIKLHVFNKIFSRGSKQEVMETSASKMSYDSDCPAKLVSCELEALMFNTLPTLLEAAFIEAGSV